MRGLMTVLLLASSEGTTLATGLIVSGGPNVAIKATTPYGIQHTR